ncbi:SDR family oxidoreductase [Calidifontibacter terrae]
MSSELVLVTGGSGYLGSRCVATLLERGYRVRTTVRSTAKEQEARDLVTAAGQDVSQVQVVRADLTSDEGWAEAVAGCRFVLHVASPFPTNVPKNPQELIGPAREGTLRVLRAAHAAGVERVVVTSSFAAVGYGHQPTGRAFTEEDWTDLSGEVPVAPYPTSKTLAERAAWEFAKDHPQTQLAVVNPVAILGPPLGRDSGTSVELIERLMKGLPGVPDVAFGVVDVRDVADLQVRAMTDPEAAGERFLAVSGDFLTVREIAEALREGLGPQARKVPTRVLPNALVKLVGRVDRAVGQVVTELSHHKNATSAKAQQTLGWSPRPAQETIVDTGRWVVSRRG